MRHAIPSVKRPERTGLPDNKDSSLSMLLWGGVDSGRYTFPRRDARGEHISPPLRGPASRPPGSKPPAIQRVFHNTPLLCLFFLLLRYNASKLRKSITHFHSFEQSPAPGGTAIIARVNRRVSNAFLPLSAAWQAASLPSSPPRFTTQHHSFEEEHHDFLDVHSSRCRIGMRRGPSRSGPDGLRTNRRTVCDPSSHSARQDDDGNRR